MPMTKQQQASLVWRRLTTGAITADVNGPPRTCISVVQRWLSVHGHSRSIPNCRHQIAAWVALASPPLGCCCYTLLTSREGSAASSQWPPVAGTCRLTNAIDTDNATGRHCVTSSSAAGRFDFVDLCRPLPPSLRGIHAMKVRAGPSARQPRCSVCSTTHSLISAGTAAVVTLIVTTYL